MFYCDCADHVGSLIQESAGQDVSLQRIACLDRLGPRPSTTKPTLTTRVLVEAELRWSGETQAVIFD